MSCLIKVSLFTRGPWATLESLTVWFSWGALGHVISAQYTEGLATEVSHMGSQPRLYDLLPVKTLGIKAQLSFPGWQDSAYSVALPSWENQHCPGLHQERTAGGSVFGTFLDSGPCILPLADFHLYPLTVIKRNYGYRNAQWVPWVLLATYQIWVRSWWPLSLQLLLKMRMGLWTVP